MAALLCLCLLLLSASSRAQEAEVPAADNSTVIDEVNQVKPAEIIELPPAPGADAPKDVPAEQPPMPAVEVPVPPPPAPELEVPVPVAETNVSIDEEFPHIAAKQIEGAPGIDTKTLVEPDSMNRMLGSRCTAAGDCSVVENTDCKDGRCLCKPGFVVSQHSLEKCVKVPSGIGDACEGEAQCNRVVLNSECRDTICQCPPNYIFFEGICWEKQMLGGFCNNSMQCDDITFSTCAQGVCDCEAPLLPSPINKCLQAAGKEYLASCVEDIQCTHSYGDEARCSNGQCKCTKSFHYNGTTCIEDKKLGEACSTDQECAISDLSGKEASRVCQKNVCGCAKGFKTLPGEEICSSSAEELAVSFTWLVCIVLAKFYLS